MALALSDFSFMQTTSYFLSNGKENESKLFFFSPDEDTPKKKSKKKVSFPFERK